MAVGVDAVRALQGLTAALDRDLAPCLAHTTALVTAQMADMTVVLGNGDTLLELVTYLDTNTELAHSELHWPGTNFPPWRRRRRRTGGT